MSTWTDGELHALKHFTDWLNEEIKLWVHSPVTEKNNGIVDGLQLARAEANKRIRALEGKRGA